MTHGRRQHPVGSTSTGDPPGRPAGPTRQADPPGRPARRPSDPTSDPHAEDDVPDVRRAAARASGSSRRGATLRHISATRQCSSRSPRGRCRAGRASRHPTGREGPPHPGPVGLPGGALQHGPASLAAQEQHGDGVLTRVGGRRHVGTQRSRPAAAEVCLEQQGARGGGLPDRPRRQIHHPGPGQSPLGRSCLWCRGLASASTARNRRAQSFTSWSATVLRMAFIRRDSSRGSACMARTMVCFMPLMS